MAKKLYFFLSYLFISGWVQHLVAVSNDSSASNTQDANDTIADIFGLLREGEKTFTVGESSDVVLVLGNTGSGKSSLTMYIAGNNDDLISVETRPGSDEYILKDVSDKKICNSTTKSCTLLPELTVDAATGTAFYDCPGFSDTRSVAYDIAATYFINKLILSADRAKIVCVISYPSVRSGGDRQDFLLLAKNMVTMIPNITKFKDSLSLVVTKVDNDYVKRGRQFVLKADDVIIENIANFLMTVRADLEDRLSHGVSPSDWQEYQRQVEFVNILLSQQGSFYPRIGLFRRPEEPGPVSSIADYRKLEIPLRKMILNYTSYTPFAPQDFKYVMADKWKVQIQGLSEEINKLLASEFEMIGDQIIIAYREKMMTSLKQGDDFDDIIADSTSSCDHFTALKNSVPSLDVESLIAKIVKGCQKARIPIEGRYITKVTIMGRYVEFISSVAGLRLINMSSLGHTLTGAVKYLTGVQRWFTFLKHLHRTLEAYGVQKYVERYAEPAENVVSHIKASTITKTFGRIDSFVGMNSIVGNATLDALETDLMKSYYNVADVELDEGKLTSLENTLTVNLLTSPTYDCDGDRFMVRGNLIRAKYVISHLSSCKGEIRFVELFAARSVFIDEDMDASGKALQLYILSPTWEVIDNRRFKLDGLPGVNQTGNPGSLDGTTGSYGLNGRFGGPGGPGGGFFGVGKLCKKCENLEVSNSGGVGGQGQDGGDGRDGEDGIKPDRPKGTDGATCHETGTKYYGGGWRQMSVTRYHCTRHGRSGQKGGSGGRAGNGGAGGYRGEHNTIFLEPPYPCITSRNGIAGTNGRTGCDGRDGKLGYDVDFEVEERFIETTDIRTEQTQYSHQKEVETCVYTEIASRPSSSDPTTYDPEIPQPALPFRDLPLIVNRYKMFARERLSPSLDSNLIQFLQNLENNTYIAALYNTQGLINDLQSLEDQLYSQKNKVPLLTWYQHFLIRISQYASHRSEFGENDEGKTVLRYLYTATLSKICSLGNPWIGGSDWVINVEGFLEIIEIQIEKLGSFKDVVEKSDVISMYKKDINSKIEEALNLIQEHIIPDLKNTITETDRNINKLVGEMRAQEDLAIQEEEALIKLREQLVEQLPLKSIVGMFQIVGSLVGFLGPVAQLVGDIAQPFLSHPQPDEASKLVTPLPPGVQNSLEIMREKFDAEKLFFKEQLSDLQSRFDSYLGKEVPQVVSKILAEVKSNVSGVIMKIEKETQEKMVFVQGSGDSVAEGRYELKKVMEKADQQLGNDVKEKDVAKAKKLLGYANKVIKIGIAGKEIYDLIKSSDDEIDKVDKALDRVRQKLDDLREYEQAIFKIIRPLCEEIYNKVQMMVKNSVDKSHAVLIVQEWNVQRALREVSVQLSEMTKGFKVEQPLVQCMGKMSFTISSMIQLYGLIQTYYERVQLADYIAAISKNYDDLGVKAPELKGAIEELRLTIQLNLVLSEYEMAKNGVNQFVFPFAKKYLEQFTHPPQLKIDMDLKRFIHDVAYQVTTVKDILSRDKNILAQVQDANVFLQVKFDRKGDLKAPFFTWNHDQYGDAITKLLSGQEVVLIADIRRGVNQNAIKFDRIGLEFRFPDELVQRKFDEAVKEFSVSMTHLGQSYYRCGEKVYVIDHPAEEIVHSMLVDNSGDYTLVNSVYMKITSNYPLFSPYSAWKIQLKTRTANTTSLDKFKFQDADLDLVGRGLYVDHKIDNIVCDNNLDDFYTLSDGIHEENQEEDTLEQSR